MGQIKDTERTAVGKHQSKRSLRANTRSLKVIAVYKGMWSENLVWKKKHTLCGVNYLVMDNFSSFNFIVKQPVTD